MLRFNHLTVINFGPFKGEQKIDFGTSDGVIIFWGDNGRGKTSLLNIFRYALFGFVQNRRGISRDYLRLCNVESCQEGIYGFSVKLDMVNDNDHYLLTREVKLREGSLVAHNNEDFIEDYFLKKNGVLLSNDDRDREINLIMPSDISRFFLFDGELLQEYEDLLDDESNDGMLIKESIEKILGMPVLTNGYADIQELAAEYITAKNKAAQNDKNTSEFANIIAVLIDKISAHKSEKIRLEELLALENSNLEAIKKQMSDTEKLRNLFAREDSEKQNLAALQIRREQLTSEIQTYMKGIWKSIIQSRISLLMKETSDAIQVIQEKRNTSKASASIIQEIQKSISAHECQICNRRLDEEMLAELTERLSQLKSQSPSISPDERQSLDALQQRVQVLTNLVSSDETVVTQSKIKDMERANVEISDCEQKIRDIQIEIKTFGDYDPGTVTLAQEYSKCQAKIVTIKDGIASERREIEEAEDSRIKLDEKISKLSSNKDVLAATKKLMLCEMIKSIFEAGITSYRTKLKTDVEKDASNLFAHMSADPDYEKLQINDNFGLDIIHKIGIPVPNRSAGFEHVVALSLIGALHKNAPLQGPVIMDSPFGRLGLKHKENVTKCLPGLANQVFLLVYVGEIDPQQTRALLGGNLLKEYTLERITSLYTKIC